MPRVTGAQARRFGRALLSGDRRLALTGLVDGAYVSVTLRRRGLRPLLADRPTRRDTIEPSEGRRITEALEAGLGVLPIAPTCLRKSVLGLRAIERRNASAVLVIGVRKDGDQTKAHAWLEADGEVINDRLDVADSFQVIATDRDLDLLPTAAVYE